MEVSQKEVEISKRSEVIGVVAGDQVRIGAGDDGSGGPRHRDSGRGVCKPLL